LAKVYVLQHARCETLGTIGDALGGAGVSAQYVRTFEGRPVPREMGGAAGLVVMGGPMGVYESSRYPFLREELRLIEQALRDERPVLGVCLGSQLLAAALGSPVVKGSRKEIGWFPLELSADASRDPLWAGVEGRFMGFHWHGDVFERPAGGVTLLSSGQTPCQAFRYGETNYGLLFHMEVTAGMVENMVETFSDELREAGADGHDILARVPDYLPGLHEIGGRVFGRWASLLADRCAPAPAGGG
jgi:GMP synthase (glutamine-hydrolysing)